MIAALQSLGGTPTVTMKTTHKYYDGKAPAPSADGRAAPAERQGGRQSSRETCSSCWPPSQAARFDGGVAR